MAQETISKTYGIVWLELSFKTNEWMNEWMNKWMNADTISHRQFLKGLIFRPKQIKMIFYLIDSEAKGKIKAEVSACPIR